MFVFRGYFQGDSRKNNITTYNAGYGSGRSIAPPIGKINRPFPLAAFTSAGDECVFKFCPPSIYIHNPYGTHARTRLVTVVDKSDSRDRLPMKPRGFSVISPRPTETVRHASAMPAVRVFETVLKHRHRYRRNTIPFALRKRRLTPHPLFRGIRVHIVVLVIILDIIYLVTYYRQGQ